MLSGPVKWDFSRELEGLSIKFLEHFIAMQFRDVKGRFKNKGFC